MHIFKNSQLVYGRGSFTSGSNHYQPHLSPLCHSSVPHTTTLQLLWILAHNTNNILRILVKAQPSTRSTWLRSLPRLGTWPRDPGLLNKYSLGHCGLSASSRHKLAFTRRHYALLTATDTLSPRQVTRNGHLLQLVDNTFLPELEPMELEASDSVSLPALSFGFQVFKEANVNTCM